MSDFDPITEARRTLERFESGYTIGTEEAAIYLRALLAEIDSTPRPITSVEELCPECGSGVLVALYKRAYECGHSRHLIEQDTMDGDPICLDSPLGITGCTDCAYEKSKDGDRHE